MKNSNKKIFVGVITLTAVTAAGYFMKRRIKQREQIMAMDEK